LITGQNPISSGELAKISFKGLEAKAMMDREGGRE